MILIKNTHKTPWNPFALTCIGIMLSMYILLAHAGNLDVYRNFWYPVYHGQPLSHCSIDGDECGLSVATHYCMLMGYSHAIKQIVANNVGIATYFTDYPKSSHLVNLNARCKGWQCNGFKLIQCVNTLLQQHHRTYHHTSQHFVYPRFNHYRLYWCYDGKSNCGKIVATAFCRRMGYRHATYYRLAQAPGASQAIGNQKLCFGTACRGFSLIDCVR